MAESWDCFGCDLETEAELSLEGQAENDGEAVGVILPPIMTACDRMDSMVGAMLAKCSTGSSGANES